jgi:thiamine-monophosphate kinase
MGEPALVARIRRMAGSRGRGLVRGIGDDCAILRTRPGEDLLVTTDMTIEGVHFRRRMPAEAVGRRALARALSDIAAMGGDPRWALVSLAVGRRAGDRWVDGFYRGFLAVARETGVALIGGDLARSRRLVADVVVIGTTPKGAALRRDGARPGDLIYVSGALGRPWTVEPRPRLALGRYLRGRATAALDLSDGLAIDLHRLCVESRVAATIDSPLPSWPGATLDAALHGGEDYELLFTARPTTRIPARHRGVPLTRIGVAGRGRPGRMMFLGRPLAPKGWDHFDS